MLCVVVIDQYLYWLILKYKNAHSELKLLSLTKNKTIISLESAWACPRKIEDGGQLQHFFRSSKTSVILLDAVY